MIRATFAVFTFLFALNAFALKLESSCSASVPSGAVEGENVDGLSHIASLSKILTTHWALTKLGPKHRFLTRVHIVNQTGNEADVHVRGSLDPYFNNDRLQWLAVRLNEAGVTKIRKLTYDEKFVYMNNLDGQGADDVLTLGDRISRVRRNLELGIRGVAPGYARNRARLEKILGRKLPVKVTLSALAIAPLSMSEFKAEIGTPVINVYSSPVLDLIAQMNKTSNNQVAEFFFDGLGGRDKFGEHMREKFGFTEKEIIFYNGSGAPVWLGEKKEIKTYNRATCRAVITVMKNLVEELERDGLKLWNALPITGAESVKNEANPMNRFYTSPLTNKALVGKTGTINVAVGLAAMVSTKSGPYLHIEIYQTRSPSEWARARRKILADFERYIIANGGALELQSENKLFVSFDSEGDAESQTPLYAAQLN